MGALVTIIAVLLLMPIAYVIGFYIECKNTGDKKQKIIGICAVLYVILVYIWIFVLKDGQALF